MSTITSSGIGARQVRLEDRALLTGAARFTSDLEAPDALHAVFVRSPHAHAMVTEIRSESAAAAPGVVAVLSDADLNLPPIFLPSFAALFTSNAFHRRPMAAETVRFVGDIVAIVIAETLAAATDAAELVEVDYEPLPVVLDPIAAATVGTPLLFPEAGTNVAVHVPFEAGERPSSSDVTVRASIGNQRMAVAPMEGAAILACPDTVTNSMTVYLSSQMPHAVRDLSCAALGWDPSQVRFVTPAVGGGFGGKTPAEPDYVAIMAAARHLGRSVRWVQSRYENLLTMQARSHRFDITLHATNDGKIESVEVDALTDVGAYPGVGCGMVMTTRSLATGAYDIGHIRFDLRCVATNTAPVGAFRGAGRPEAIALLERAVDILARQLQIDPVELRRRNLIRVEQFPYRSVCGPEYDTGDYQRSLDEALRIVGYEALREKQRERRASGSSKCLGVGVSCYVEVSASNPGFNAEYASVEITTDGRAAIIAGTQSHGQGHRTAYSQILSSVLGIDPALVDFVDGDTTAVKRGMGTGGSRSIQVGGSAVLQAGQVVLDKATKIAAHLLEADPADIAVANGGLGVRGVPTSVLTWRELATAAADPSRLPPDTTPRLFADPGFEQRPAGTAPFGCHIAVVDVDTETGAVELLRFVAIDDCGTVINPMMVEGQVHGGILGGLAQALFEEVRYDDHGNPLTTSFADYAIPTAAELISFETEHTVTVTPHNPLGAKGIGEGGTTGSLGAIHNAVVDAVAHLGVGHIDLPLTPANVWAALQAPR